jgi:hypothetical protein
VQTVGAATCPRHREDGRCADSCEHPGAGIPGGWGTGLPRGSLSTQMRRGTAAIACRQASMLAAACLRARSSRSATAWSSCSFDSSSVVSFPSRAGHRCRPWAPGDDDRFAVGGTKSAGGDLEARGAGRCRRRKPGRAGPGRAGPAGRRERSSRRAAAARPARRPQGLPAPPDSEQEAALRTHLRHARKPCLGALCGPGDLPPCGPRSYPTRNSPLTEKRPPTSYASAGTPSSRSSRRGLVPPSVRALPGPPLR